MSTPSLEKLSKGVWALVQSKMEYGEKKVENIRADDSDKEEKDLPVTFEALQRKSRRAKRFELQSKHKEDTHCAMLPSIDAKELPTISVDEGRLYAAVIHGVDNMSTKDVFAYFSDFPPGSAVEWIDDSSSMENFEEKCLNAVGESKGIGPVEQADDVPQGLCICLACGAMVGYLKSHAESHFHATGHISSLELFSQRVWDFSEENFTSSLRNGGPKEQSNGKLDKYDSGQQSTYPPTDEMEWQRFFFEDKKSQIENDAAEKVDIPEYRASLRSSSEDLLKKALEKLEQLKLKLSEAEEEKKKEKEEYTQVVTKAVQLSSDLKKMRELNKRLSENQMSQKERLKQMEAKREADQEANRQEISDLKEQLKDLRYHLKTQQAIASAPDETRQELQDGRIIVSEGSSPTHHLRKPRRKQKKRK